MKKSLTVIFALLMLLSLGACGSSASSETSDKSVEENETIDENPVEESSETASDEALCGGWTLPEDFTAVTLPEDVQSAFETAAADYTEASLEPAALLAEQSVAGTNYAILCRADGSYWTIVFIYLHLDGGAELLAVKDLPLADYTYTDTVKDPEALQGGWGAVFSAGASMTDESQKVFDQISETERDYHAVALLGTQVVAGTNCAMLAVSGEGSMDSHYQLTVLTVCQDLDGNVELVSACDLDVADLADFY